VFPDATELLPFADRAFDYVHVDHVIERVSWEEGALLLRECHRILKPGGTLRIATPDIAALFGLYAGEAGAAGEEYIRWSTARFVAPAGLHSATFAINHAFHQGRRFLYDAGLMERALGEAGFAEIQRCARGESVHPHLRGMETAMENSGDEELAGFGTMLFEATVPA
jgi:predicted SAM-dependent methyltransferase